MKYLYKYPQRAFPYSDLVEENRRRTRLQPEYELLDTGVFDDDRYFDVQVEYAKATPDDILIRITATNRGPDAAPLHRAADAVVQEPCWTWYPDAMGMVKPRIEVARTGSSVTALKTMHRSLPAYLLYCETPDELLFTENDTNTERILGQANAQPYVKDAFDNFLVHGQRDAVNPQRTGTKAAAHYVRQVPAGESVVIQLRLCPDGMLAAPFSHHFDATFIQRPARGRCLLPTRHAISVVGRHAQCAAPGLRRHVVEQAVLPLHGQSLARRRQSRLEAA
jgi:hypothetical protein